MSVSADWIAIVGGLRPSTTVAPEAGELKECKQPHSVYDCAPAIPHQVRDGGALAMRVCYGWISWIRRKNKASYVVTADMLKRGWRCDSVPVAEILRTRLRRRSCRRSGIAAASAITPSRFGVNAGI